MPSNEVHRLREKSDASACLVPLQSYTERVMELPEQYRGLVNKDAVVRITAEADGALEALREELRASRQAERAAWRYEPELEAERDELQAKVDALMFEYCPDEMTPEQKDNWARSQRRTATDGQASIAFPVVTPRKKDPLGALHPEQRLRAEQVTALTGRGRTWLYKAVAEGRFPAPERDGRRCTRWRAGGVLEWLQKA